MDRERVLAFNEKSIEEFRESGGWISAFGESPVLLLTTTGTKSGKPRTSPLMYLDDENDPDRVYVFASAAGADTNPAWFRNLVAHPQDIEVEIGEESLAAEAEVLSEPLRAQVYEVQASRYSNFADYQSKTERPIPVIALRLQR
jgi:deazaflavin-dependent oxidoreductase (nitroreductase family)